MEKPIEKAVDNFVLTEDMLTSLKCSLCESFLSVPPILITSEDGTKMKCGRCNFKSHEVARAVCYENLAKQMKFPCSNKPCEEILNWEDVKLHEKNCDHRTILCMKTNCNERIRAQDYISHFKMQHEKSLYTDAMVLKNIHSAYGMGVLQNEYKAYIILFDCDNTKFGLIVCSLEPTNKVFNLSITSPGSKLSITINEQPITRFNERYHCYKCMQGVCKCDFHAYKHHRRNIFSKMTTKVDKDVVKKTFGSQGIYYTIDIVDKKEDSDEFDDLVDKNMILDEVSEDENEEICSEQENFLRDILVCPQCSNSLEAPIYQCVTGHVLCCKCRDGAETCSTCEAKIENTRNYLLEEVAMSLEAVDTQKPEDRPQTDLKDKEIVCPQPKCFEKINLKDISDHYKENHIDNFHFNTFSIKNVYAYYNIDILVKYGKTFILLFDFDDVNFGISICSLDNAEGLEYEITLSSSDNCNSIRATRQKLVVFDDVTHCFKCALGTCKNDQHHGSHKAKRRDIFKDMVTKINRDSTRRMFNTGSMNYTVRLIDVSAMVQRDKIIRQMFECSICKDYMIPPILQCLSGHSLCNTCASKVEKCPSCEASLTGTRNFALEQATEKAQLACQNLFENCIYRTSLKRIAAHESECPRKPKRLCSTETKNEPAKK